MISSITTDTREYVLERDRDSIPTEQTVFHIRSKTVRESSETAANYAKAQIQKKRGKQTEFDADILASAEQKEFVRCVKKVTNFLMLSNAPGDAARHFAVKATENPSVYEQQEGSGNIIVKETQSETDVKFIYDSMDIADTEEVMEAAVNQSKLEESVKN